MRLGGRFIVIDGPDGSGKGTQIERLLAHIREAGGEPVYAKDPGGTVIGERIRHVLLGYDLAEMSPRCEALLFMASRAQLIAEVIRPAIEAGKTVVCDRFISATCAYQVAAGFPRDDVIGLGRLAVGDTWPHLTLVLDVPVEVGFERVGRSRRMAGRNARRDPTHAEGQFAMFEGATTDAMEKRSIEFHRRVRENFLALPSAYPAPVKIIDATRSPDDVQRDVLAALQEAFG